jgi:hypothetical protein
MGLTPKKLVFRFSFLEKGITAQPPFFENSQASVDGSYYTFLCIELSVVPSQSGQPVVAGVVDRIPPHAYFLVSAVFHYLGPACAVLLFRHMDSLSVAWMRIATAAIVFAVWRRPWRFVLTVSPAQRGPLCVLGAVLGLMNSVFYLAIERLP